MTKIEDGDIAFNRVEVREEPDMENQYEKYFGCQRAYL